MQTYIVFIFDCYQKRFEHQYEKHQIFMDQTYPRIIHFPCWMMHVTDQPNQMLKSLMVIFEYQNDYNYCPHHKFKSSETFVKNSTKRLDELSINFDTIYPDINSEWIECCEECYYRIFIYIHMNFRN
eukprot:302508_1